MPQRWATALAVFYGLCFVVWRLLVASPLYEQWWPLQVSEIFAVWSLAPLPVFLLAGILGRGKWMLLALLIPLVWFGSEYGRLFIPSSTPVLARAGEDGTMLRVMTFNMWRRYERFADFASTVEEWQPDLIALQEVDPLLYDDLDQLVDGWPFQVRARVRGSSNIVVLSKMPLTLEEVDQDQLGCHCVQTVVEWQGETVRVVVVHVRAPKTKIRSRKGIPRLRSFDASSQVMTYDALLERIAVSKEPLIVLGDFNTTERQAGYRWLQAAGLQDAHEAVGFGLGLTYPAPWVRVRWLPFPLIRIDHVFFDGAWRATQTWTTPLMDSDHQAVVADLRFVAQD
jgi:endonuclease/exonuclease/phosphatase (EEP) superfamily protein YafD